MRRKLARLTLEQLERRELFAGNVLPTLGTSAGDGFCGPLPLEESALVAGESTAPLSPQENEYFERFGDGNVTAEVIDGRLIIRGDARGNHLSLYGYGGAYGYDEQTIVMDVGWWAKVNGEFVRGTDNLRERYAFFTGVTALDIDLGDGDDSITIHAVKIPSLTIRTGAGDDHVSLVGPTPMSMSITAVYNPYPMLTGPKLQPYQAPQALQIDGDLLIDTGAGNDRLMPFAAVSGAATVNMGTGDDSYIEAPHGVNDPVETPVRIGDVYWFLAPRRVTGKLTATGPLTIDLGPGQDLENIPADYRSDSELVGRLQNVTRVLDFYRGMIERGEDTPGTAQIIKPPTEVPARINAEGRLEIDFGFTPGYGRVIDRLQARGVVLEAYSIQRGAGRALVREEDLKLFANLPGLGYFHTRSYLFPNSTFPHRSDPEWDYVLPGSSTAAEVVELPPRPERSPEEERLIPPITILIGDGPQSVIGPPRLEDLKNRADGDFGSLLESYYGSALVGPQQL